MSPAQSNPNTQTTVPANPEYSPVEKSLLEIGKVDDWRTHQHGILNGLREADPDFLNGEYVTLFNDNVETSLDEYLVQQGIDPNSANYARLRELYRNASLDRVRDDEWYASPAARGDDLNDTTSARDNLIQLLNAEKSVPDPEVEQAPERLDVLRKAKYEAFVERMKGPAYGAKRKELDQAYKDAELAYMVALTRQNKQNIEDKRTELVTAGKTDDEIARQLGEYAKTEAERVYKEDQDKQHELFIENTGLLGKLMEKYANLPRRKKLLTGVGLGILTFGGGLAIGAAAGALGGLVGGAGLLAGTGAALMRLWGGARTYQLRKAELYKSPTEVPEFAVQTGAGALALHLQQRSYIETTSREQIEKADKIKRRAVKWALGTVALGAVGGVVGHAVADGGIEHLFGGQAQHAWEQAHSAPTSGGGSESDMGLPDKTHIPIKIPVQTPEKVSVPTAVDIWKGAPTESVLQKLYSGLSERDAYVDINALYDKLGPNGVFTDASGHVIRLSEHSPNNIWLMQSSGKIQLSPEAQAYLDQLHGHGGGTGAAEAAHSAATKASEVVTSGGGGGTTGEVASNIGAVEALNNNGSTAALEQVINQGDVSPVNVVSRTEGWYQTFNELRRAGVVDIPNAQYGKFLSQVGPELSKVQYSNGTPVAYFDRFHHEWRMYTAPRGERLPAAALRVINRLAARNNYTLAA